MRPLKHHEQKLLKKVNFLHWAKEDTLRENEILRRYHIQDREDYHKYNKLVGQIQKMVTMLKNLPPGDEVRIKMTTELLDKLFHIGLVKEKDSLEAASKVTASTFCRRRLPVILVRLKFAEDMKHAVTIIEQGHIKVGPNLVTDPAMLITRPFEDYVTWAENSKFKRKVLAYNNQLDDYDLL